jgi:hypothetical protein
MSLFNSIGRGFGMSLGSTAAKKVTSSSVDSLWRICWKFVKWCFILTFLFGVIQGIIEASTR